MKNIRICLAFLITIGIGSIAKAQESKPEDVKKFVDAQNYVFVAQRVSPIGGRTRDVSGSGYDVSITKDKVISYLPYFGKAYAAPADPTQGGIKFTSTKFEYSAKQNSKGWGVTIKPKDASDVQQLHLDIFDNGRATLQVISTNRQNISFDGYVEEGKAGEKKAF